MVAWRPRDVDELVITATFNERRVIARAVAVADDPSTVYVVERDGDGAAIVARAAPSFDERWRHGGIRVGDGKVSLAVSPDGARAALVWQVNVEAARLLVIELRGDDGWTTDLDGASAHCPSVRWVAGGARLLVEIPKGFVQVFDARSREQIDGLHAPGCLAFSADGNRHVASVTDDGGPAFALVDGAMRREVARWRHGLPSDQNSTLHAGLAAGDVVWCTSSVGAQTSLHRFAPGEPARRVDLTEPVGGLLPLPEGAALMTFSGRLGRATHTDTGGLSVEWYDPAEGWTDAWSGEMNGLSCNGRFAATRFHDCPALLDLTTGALTAPTDGHPGGVCHLAASADGSRVAAVWPHGGVEVLAADSLAPLMAFEAGRDPLACAFAADGREVHVREQEAVASLTVVDGSSRRAQALGGGVTNLGEGSFAVSPDARFAVVIECERVGAPPLWAARMRLVELSTGAVTTFTPRLPRPMNEPRFVRGSAEVRGIMVVDGRASIVTLDTRSGEVLTEQPIDERLPTLSDDDVTQTKLWLSRDGGLVFAEVWNRERRLLASLAVNRGAMATAHFSDGELVGHDDRRLAWLTSIGGEAVLLVADAATLAVTARLTLPAPMRVDCACFVAGGAVVLGLDDGRVLRAAPR